MRPEGAQRSQPTTQTLYPASIASGERVYWPELSVEVVPTPYELSQIRPRRVAVEDGIRPKT